MSVGRKSPPFCVTGKPLLQKRLTVKAEKDFGMETDRYYIFRIHFQNGYGDAEYFQSKIPGRKRLIIVLPIYGKHEIPARWFSEYLTLYNSEADFNVLYLQEREHEDPLDLDQFLLDAENETLLMATVKESVEKFKHILERIGYAVDWAEQEEAVDAKRIGIAGFSTSALAASMAMSVEPRLTAGAIFMGGGNIHEMFEFAEEPRIRLVRERILKNSQKTSGELVLLLRSIFREVEPTCLARFVDPARVLFIDSYFDEFIPASGREDYWHALGKPERITFFSGHRMAFLSLTPAWGYYSNRKAIEFFRKKM